LKFRTLGHTNLELPFQIASFGNEQNRNLAMGLQFCRDRRLACDAGREVAIDRNEVAGGL
jgi:hypothetical protein